jgi:uncharacterized repeat protein (TIGR01451 family)
MRDQRVDRGSNDAAPAALPVQGGSPALAALGEVAALAWLAALAALAARAWLAVLAARAGLATLAARGRLAALAARAGLATLAARGGLAALAARAGLATLAARAGLAALAARVGLATLAARAGLAALAARAGLAALAARVGLAALAARGGLAALSGLAVLALLDTPAVPAEAQTIVGRGFGESYVGFQDVNGNGVLDCLEPVTIRAAYFDPASDTATGSITGQMVAPFAGAGGLSFIPGSVQIDRLFSVGDCVATIVTGNDPSDVEATVSFSCGPPRPATGQGAGGGNVVAFLYRAAFRSSQPNFTAVMHGTTSDGLDAAPQLVASGNIGATCTPTGGMPSVTVAKAAAGTGVPGSTLLYTIAATDQSGLGLGGLQLTDEIPADTVFDAAASSPGWVCPTTSGVAGAGSLCRLPAGNLGPNATVTRYLAVDIVPALPAGVAAISNTACARSGPSTVVGCGSVSTPTAGRAVLTLAKSLASGTGTPGGTVVFNLGVVNSGTQDSGPVTLSETVPADTTWAGDGGWSCSGTGPGSTCSLVVGNLPAAGAGGQPPPAASARFSVVVASPLPAGVTRIANTACADAAGAVRSCGTATVPTTGTALLAVNKTVAGTGAPGSDLVYSIAVQNTGNQDAANVTVTDAVPGLTTFVAAGSSAAWSCAGAAAGSTCTAAIASLPAGESALLTFVVRIAPTLLANVTSIGNQACASAPGLAAACGATGSPTTGQPSLHLAKSYAGGAVVPNALLVFTLTVSNSGNQDLGAAVVTETVPALSSFDAAASDGRWSCAGAAAGSSCTLHLLGVAAGSSQTAAFAVRAAAALPESAVIANAACVTGVSALPEGADGTPPASSRAARQGGARPVDATAAAPVLAPVPATVMTPRACGSVETPPALAVDTTLAAAVVGHGGPAVPGDRIHYTLTVPNQAAGTMKALAAAAALDAYTALAAGSVTASQGVVTTGNGAGDVTVAVALGDLAAGGTATIEWEVTVAAQLPPGITQVAAQVETTGSNIPPDESGPPPPPSTPGPTATPVTSGAPPPRPQAIPTLDTWGLGAMTVLLAGMAAAVLRRRRSRSWS